MNFKERIFHSILFELGAIGVASIAILIASKNIDTHTAIGSGFIMAVMAMTWNFVFNYYFDKIYTGPREERHLSLRIFHTISFELGLLLFTIPVLAYLLNLSLWEAFLADLGLTLLIMVYALIFNYIYDNVRIKWLKPA